MSSLRAIPDEFDASRVEEGLINRNPVTAFRPIRTTNAKKDVFSLAQIQRLLETAEGDWNGLILCATSLVAVLPTWRSSPVAWVTPIYTKQSAHTIRRKKKQ
jgi:hypothetical protein